MISIFILTYPHGIQKDFLLLSTWYPIEYPTKISNYILISSLISKWYPINISNIYPKTSSQISDLLIWMISKDIQRYPFIFIFPAQPTCQSRWNRSDYKRRHFWQQACPFLALWDNFRPWTPCMIPLRLQLQYYRWPACLPQQLGCCHGSEPWRSARLPVWRPRRWVSASGNCIWLRSTTRKKSKIDLKMEKSIWKWRSFSFRDSVLLFTISP